MKTYSSKNKKYPWFVGNIAIGPPRMPVPADVPHSQTNDVPVWTGRSSDVNAERGVGYSTWGEVRERGFRFNNNEQF